MSTKPFGIMFTKIGAEKFERKIEKTKPIDIQERMDKDYKFVPSKKNEGKFDKDGIYRK